MGHVTVQHLVGDMTHTLVIMPIRILIPTLSNFGTPNSLPNGVTDRFTFLAGTDYFSPDEVEVFYLA